MSTESWFPRNCRSEAPDTVAAWCNRYQRLAVRASLRQNALACHVQSHGWKVSKRIQKNAEMLGKRRRDQIRRQNSVAAQHLIDPNAKCVGTANGRIQHYRINKRLENARFGR
jgi:hypothetical protein